MSNGATSLVKLTGASAAPATPPVANAASPANARATAAQRLLVTVVIADCIIGGTPFRQQKQARLTELSHCWRTATVLSGSDGRSDLMNAPRTFHNLAIAGFMGTGKTSVGRLAAQQLHFRFVDTDELIESRAGKRIADIFAQEGEAGFRQRERQIVAELGGCVRTVIATGGGLTANEANLASLKAHALVVCLWASPEVIWDRVRHQGHRPLLNDPDPLGKIRELLAAREPFYRQADVLVNTQNRSIKEVAQHVVHQFHLARQRSGHDHSGHPHGGHHFPPPTHPH
jgi:shikimate kinase